MNLQDLLARVPLLLSYPAIVVASNLIIPTYEDIRASGDTNIILIDRFIRLVLLPIFSAACTVTIGFILGIIPNVFNEKKNDKTTFIKNSIPIFLMVTLTCQLTFILGTTQTTCLFLLTVKQGLLSVENKQKLPIIHLLKIYGPLAIISISIASPFKVSSILPILIAYVSVASSIHYLKPLMKTVSTKLDNILLSATDNTSSEKVEDTNSKNKVFVFSLIIIGMLCLLSLSIVSVILPMYHLQYSMIFVFVGCLAFLYLSLQDISTAEENNGSNESIWFTKYNILSTGVMSLILQYLSFNSIAASILKDILTISFVFVAELSSNIGMDVLEHRTNTHHHTHDHRASTDGKDSNTYSNSNIFKQMATSKDTRSIFSFLLLNTTFMFVQLLYSFRSKSLGLLSDSLHMALDCTSLLLGLIASILSKKPPSEKYPFSLSNYLETLSGFTNGVLLLGIVGGIYVEAIGRIFNPIHLKGTNELLVVAMIGLLVNLFGLFAFEHGHSHAHGNENMRGIFLHVLADTLGSVGVVISTLLIKLTHWHIFDPVASIFIATLILLSAIPLIKSTASNMLLKLDEKSHNSVKSALNQISSTPGITGYTTPRFWSSCMNAQTHSHAHSHNHSNEQHEHGHEHSHAEHNEKETVKQSPSLIGYVHVQYMDCLLYTSRCV